MIGAAGAVGKLNLSATLYRWLRSFLEFLEPRARSPAFWRSSPCFRVKVELRLCGSAVDFSGDIRLERDPIGEEEGREKKGHEEDSGSHEIQCQEGVHFEGLTHQEGCAEKESCEEICVEEGRQIKAGRFEKAESREHARRLGDATSFAECQDSKVKARETRRPRKEKQRR
jgi:hypothetical protein